MIDFILIIHSFFSIGVLQSRKDSKQEHDGSDYNDKINAIEAEDSGLDDKEQISEYDEEAGDEEHNIDEMSHHMVTNMTVDDGGSSKSAAKPQQSKSKLNFQNSVSPEVCHTALK